MVKEKLCPQCGSEMTYRLGVFDCPQCGHTEEDQAATAGPAQASGPGFRREPWQQATRPGAGPPDQVPPPRAIGTIFAPGAAPPPGSSGTRDVSYPGSFPALEKEKRLYFAISAGCVGVLVLLLIVVSIAAGAEVLGPMVALILEVGVGLLVMWLVLFSSMTWTKYCCLGCTSIEIIGMVIGLLTLPASKELSDIAGAERAFVIGATWLVVLVMLVWRGWLVWILWRDVQS